MKNFYENIFHSKNALMYKMNDEFYALSDISHKNTSLQMP